MLNFLSTKRYDDPVIPLFFSINTNHYEHIELKIKRQFFDQEIHILNASQISRL